jgi:phospholipid/cholesterol/gamma-HCH transport system permease protein
MSVAVRIDREGDHASLIPTGPFDLAHAAAAADAVDGTETNLTGCRSVEIDLSHLERLDGTGAVLLARLLDRLDAEGRQANIVEGSNRRGAHLVALYREGRAGLSEPHISAKSTLEKIGAVAAHLPDKANEALDFTGRCVAALPKAAARSNSVDWRSLPRLVQEIGADGLPVTSAANLLIGVIMGFFGVSQLGGVGMVNYIPAMVATIHFRELGPLVTAMIVAGRSGAGIASEIATMKVSDEVDALRSMGFDPVRWLVVPRCLALALTVPLLAWIGDLFAIVDGLAATRVMTHMTTRAYIQATANAVTADLFLTGLIKGPFLGLAIGLIACGQGLLARGGAAAVGTRTTTAVVMAIFAVIVVSALFTFFYALIGI